MVRTKQTAKKANTPGMSTHQDVSTSSSSSGEEMDTDVEEPRQKGNKPRYNHPIFTGHEGKVTQAPEGEQVKQKVVLEYSSDKASESQLDQMVSPDCPTADDVARIKRVKKAVKLTIPHQPTVEGLTESFITWYKDHGMMTSLKKALRANRWTEEMIQEFKKAYIRKYQISQNNVRHYPDERMSDEDELEESDLADLVGPRRGDMGKAATGRVARTSTSKGGGGKRPATQKGKDSGKGANGSKTERTTKKKGDKKTNPPDPPKENKKKVAKHKKDQGGEPRSTASKPPPEKQPKKVRKKKKEKEAAADPAEPAPKKRKTKRTPSATLGRAPDAEAPPAPEVPQETAPVPVEQRSSMDKQLEAHFPSTDLPATVAQPSQTTSSTMVPQVLELGSFLIGLRESIPRDRAQQVVVATPLPRWPKQTWIPVPVAEAQMARAPTVR